MAEHYFDAYLKTQSQDGFRDDSFLQGLIDRFAGSSAPQVKEALARLAPEIAGPFAELAKEGAQLENLPRLRPYDAYEHRVDDVVLPAATRELMRRIYLKRPFRRDSNPWEFYGLLYLLSQNGEAGVMCSLACTDGMVRLLRKLGTDNPPLQNILGRLETGGEGVFYHAAQFVTEIQGGSDAGANVVEARREGDVYRLSGNKWFCSNITADYFVVTARPQGAPPGPKGVALFAVPAYDENRKRNGYRIDRLKNKLGTQSLPTVELSFDGALAYPIGPLDKGLSNMVGIVLTTSRLHCALTNAAFVRQVARLAAQYAQFREAFGQPIARFPLVKKELNDLEEAARRLAAGTWAILAEQLALEVAPQSTDTAVRGKILRILIMMNKVVVSREASERIHAAVSLFGGNGIEEEWSVIPRLLRDAIINEVWEGPHTLLTMRALGDLEQSGLTAEVFVEKTLSQSPVPTQQSLAKALGAIFKESDVERKAIAFAAWMQAFMLAFQRQYSE